MFPGATDLVFYILKFYPCVNCISDVFPPFLPPSAASSYSTAMAHTAFSCTSANVCVVALRLL